MTLRMTRTVLLVGCCVWSLLPQYHAQQTAGAALRLPVELPAPVSPAPSPVTVRIRSIPMDDGAWKALPQLQHELAVYRSQYENAHYNVDYLEYMAGISEDTAVAPPAGIFPYMVQNRIRQATAAGVDWTKDPLLLQELACYRSIMNNPHYTVEFLRYLSSLPADCFAAPPVITPDYARRVIATARARLIFPRK